MAETRKTHKVKIYNPDDKDTWIEVERLDELTVENGRGFKYQKKIFSFVWENEKEDGTWDGSDERTEIKRITNPDNKEQFVDVPVINFVVVEKGRGKFYQRTKLTFDNSKNNDRRETHTKTVKASDGSGGRLEVEVIDKLLRQRGRGKDYKKTVVTFEDQGSERQ